MPEVIEFGCGISQLLKTNMRKRPGGERAHSERIESYIGMGSTAAQICGGAGKHFSAVAKLLDGSWR